MTQEKFIERLLEEAGYAITPGSLSRIETGKSPYSQDFLEAAATVFGCAPQDLIMRDPTNPDAAWSLLASMKPKERERWTKIIQAARDEDDQATGTDG